MTPNSLDGEIRAINRESLATRDPSAILTLLLAASLHPVLL